MKNNGDEDSSTYQRMNPRKIINKKKSNRMINNINNKIIPSEYNTDITIINSNKLSNSYKYRKMFSKNINQSNNDINYNMKKSNEYQHNNLNNTKRNKLTNFKGKNNLILPTKNNNLKGNISSYLSKAKMIKGVGTKLDISKSEIQYPLNYSKNNINSKQKLYNDSNSNQENNNKEIDLRISLKLGSKNNKEKEGKYNISSPLNKSNHLINKKQRQSMKNFNHINKRKNNETYSPVFAKHNNNREVKSFNNNNYFTKRDDSNINNFNSCNNFYKKNNINTKRKSGINFNSSFTNTMNQNDFHKNKINNNNEYFFQIDQRIMNENNNKYKYYQDNSNYSNEDENISSSRYRSNIVTEEEIQNNQIQKYNNIRNDISHQNDLLEEFCYYIEEFMFLNVKNNFETFISKLKEYSQDKYLNFLLLKRVQNQTIRKKFFKNSDSSYEHINQKLNNNQYLSSTINNNSNINNYKKEDYFSNNISKEYIKRKTLTNFNNNFSLSNKYSEANESTYHRKSQEKIIIKNFDSFNDKDDDIYNTTNEKIHKSRRISNEKYDTNLYIPKKYRHVKNGSANKNQIKKNVSYNYNKINPYFTNINQKKEALNNISREIDGDISNDNEEEIIQLKIEKGTNIKNKKCKNHNISCDNKHSSKYSIENKILNKINLNKNKSPSMTMNMGQLQENKRKQIYNKKKVKISQPKSKIFLNKQIHANLKDKQLKEHNNIAKEEQTLNMNINKKINDKNNNEHYGIMTLSSNVSENSNDIEEKQNEKEEYNEYNEHNEYNIISSTKRNIKSNPINKINDLNTDKNNQRYEIEENNQNDELNIAKISRKDKNGNNDNSHFVEKEEDNNHINDISKTNVSENYDNINNYNDLRIKMSNGKNLITDDIENNEYLQTREIIVKDVSTRDRKINVFIKYIEDPKFNLIKKYSFNNNPTTKRHILNIFQTDSIYLPSIYPSFLNQKNNSYKNNKYYKNMNDKNNQNKMNRILSSIIEEEEKSKAAGSMNNSILSDEEVLKNGNYSYFFIQSIIYFIGFLQTIFNDKKKSLYFYFFKILKKIKNDSYLKGLINQKKLQSLSKLKEDEDNNDKNNTSGDILLYNVNDNLDMDINLFTEGKNENKNPKNKIQEFNTNTTNTQYCGKYTTDNNSHLLKDENVYKISDSNKKINMNLSMDNFYLYKNGSHKYNKKILKSIINNIEINRKIKIYRNDLKELEKTRNGRDFNNNISNDNESKENVNLDYEKKVTFSEVSRRLSDIVNDFRICLIKFSMKK